MDENVVLIFLAVIAIIWNVITKVFNTFKEKMREMERTAQAEKPMPKSDVSRKIKEYQERVTTVKPVVKQVRKPPVTVYVPTEDLSAELEMESRPKVDLHYVKMRKKKIRLKVCPAHLRKAVIWSEILAPPLGMRDDPTVDRY